MSSDEPHTDGCSPRRINSRHSATISPIPPIDKVRQVNVNPTSEHAVYLRLFVTNAGGW
jgi:hypothetical protein